MKKIFFQIISDIFIRDRNIIAIISALKPNPFVSYENIEDVEGINYGIDFEDVKVVKLIDNNEA